MKKNIILLGAPGAGKGTEAQMLSEKFNIPHISTGDLLREESKNKTKLGKKVEPYIDSGRLVPDEIIIGILKKRISKKDCKNGFILDGFPRTIAQAEALDKNRIRIDKVINLVASKKSIIKRLSGRRICNDCRAVYHIKNMPPNIEGLCNRCGAKLIQRDDDKKEAIEQRFKVYEKESIPLISYYKKKGILVEITANLLPDAILKKIEKSLS